MERRFFTFLALLIFFIFLVFEGTRVVLAQQTGPTRAKFDVTHYRIDAQIQPEQHFLRATADVTFTPLEETRAVVFELNGSLKIESIQLDGKPLSNFVQDPLGTDSLGPNVRIDLGNVVTANRPMTLRFAWSGALTSPEGGPLPTRRLAYIGREGSYLMYASRWFPFHDYAADRATSEITISVPAGMTVAGPGDEPPVQTSSGGLSRARFVNRQPALIGNIAAGNYITRSLKIGGFDLQFFVQPGSERVIDRFAETIGHALAFYKRQYGAATFGSHYTV
ncbi:MAG: hypothetical protein ACRD63_11925, partial [Pyrinomonadaceae bacterium]